MKRLLTEKERKTIKGYNLSPQIEQRVWDIWRESEQPNEMGFLKTMFGQLVILVTILAFSVSLWVNYFMPGISHMQGVLNMVRFFFWVLLPLTTIIVIFQAVAVNDNEKEAFKKYALDFWMEKRTFVHKIGRVNQFALVIGFILNDYLISGMMALVCFLAVFFLRSGIRVDVQEIMDKVVPSQNGDIIEDEFRSM